MIKDKNYFINKLNKLEFSSNYSKDQIEQEDKNTSHDIIGTILTQKAMCQGYSTIIMAIA